MPVTFVDFEKRYENIRKQNPKVKKCSVKGCKNPRDSTPLLGEDTTCAYHRLLFDYWIYEVIGPKSGYSEGLMFMSRKGMRRAFTNWRNKTGKEECDKIVLQMAQDGINWEC